MLPPVPVGLSGLAGSTRPRAHRLIGSGVGAQCLGKPYRSNSDGDGPSFNRTHGRAYRMDELATWKTHDMLRSGVLQMASWGTLQTGPNGGTTFHMRGEQFELARRGRPNGVLLPMTVAVRTVRATSVEHAHIGCGTYLRPGNVCAVGGLVFKAPRHVDIHNEPLRYCLVACNNSDDTLSVSGRPWPAHGSETFLYHGDVLTVGSGGSSMKMVVTCAAAPWPMPVLPRYERPEPPPPTVRRPPSDEAAARPTHLEHMLGLQACM